MPRSAARSFLLASMVLASAAVAQNAAQPASRQAAPTGVSPVAPPPVQNFHSIIVRDEKGNPLPIEEPLDILAIGNNHLITMEDRAKIASATATWLESVDQLAIDNLDFMEAIDPMDGSPGVLDKLDLNDNKQVHKMSIMMTQLMSAGTLTTELQTKNVITGPQASVNQQILNDYLQSQMNERVSKTGGSTNLTPEQQAEQTRNVTGFLYYMTCRDSLEAYRRLLAEAAPVAEKALATISGAPGAAAPLAKKAAAAASNDDRRAAMRAMLQTLDFSQRQALLRKTRELNPPKDPLAGLGPVKPAPGK